MSNNNWTKEETIIAFNVYCKIPFKESKKTHPTIIKYAKILGRSPSALNMKVGNIGRLDPVLKEKGIVGLSHGSKIEKEVWDEFSGDWEKLAFESELLISKFSKKSIEEVSEILPVDNKEGLERESIIKQRVNQNFFRTAVLSSYYSKCCITGLAIPELLVASHIIPWSQNKEQRLNPMNGLCLNALHDKAYDRGFITITSDYTIKVSKFFNEYENYDTTKEFFVKYQNRKINLPDKFVPSSEFLSFHEKNIFRK
jgi:putative restriction endonuclease